MSKNQTRSSNSAVSSGSSRGDVSFIRAISTSNQLGTSTNPPSINPEAAFDSIQTHHFDMNAPHLPHQSQSSQEISHHALHGGQDPSQQSHSLHSHHHYHHRSKAFQQPLHQTLEQYHPDLPDSGPFLVQGGTEAPVHTGVESWGSREEALAAELEEAKIRVAQMEKTMRWWSDCTSNWREKWNKARTERNKAREENRILRVKLESVSKDLSRLKREKKEQTEDKDGKLCKSSSSKSTENLSEKEKSTLSKSNEKDCESTDELSEASSPKSSLPYQEKDVDDLEGKEAGQVLSFASQESDLEFRSAERITQLEEELAQSQAKSSQAMDNVVVMQRKLDDADNTIQAERLESCNQTKAIHNLKKEVELLQTALDEATVAKNNAVKELDEATEKYKEELDHLSMDLEDETNSRSSMDKHVMDLRRELERLQSENASEWGKRERLESEKLVLERENKRLTMSVKDLEEEVARKTQVTSSAVTSDLQGLQFELVDRNKALTEVKHTNTKLKKILADRATELDHNRRRAEQYEAEVRKLRVRIDELKHDLATAEDEVDRQTNTVKKSQRTIDELQEQVESLQVQVNHLQNRLRNGLPTRSSSLKTFALDDPANLADSETDFDEV